MLWTTGNAHSGPFMNLAHGLVSSHSKKEEGMWIGTSLSRSVQCCSNCQEASMSNAKASSALRYLCSLLPFQVRAKHGFKVGDLFLLYARNAAGAVQRQ